MALKDNENTVGEEVSAFGQRVEGVAKDAAGSITGNRDLEREGERDRAEGRQRQASNYVTGLYDSPESAGRAYEGLTSTHGYKADDIDVLMTDETRKRHFGDVKPGTELEAGSKAAKGFGAGSAIGTGVGAALAAIFAVGTSVVVPGLGLVVAGPIAAALAGAGAGGVTGGIIGALIGAGIPEERAVVYESGLKKGGILIGTRARDEQHAEQIEREFGTYGGTDIRR